MKSLKCLPPLLVLFSIASVPSAIADHAKTVLVNNNTTYTLTECYASSSDSAAWDTSNNLTAGQSIGPGQSTTVTIADDSDECTYDLMAVLYGAAEHAYTYQVNACDGSSAHWDVNQ